MPLAELEFFEFSIDETALANATDEEPFADAALEVLKEVGQIVVVLSSATRRAPDGRPCPWARDEAVLGGLMVRLMKLLFGFLDGSTERGGEIANYFTRGLLETAVNIRYLIQEDTLDAFHAFVAHSFRNDKRLLAVIERNVAARGGTELPIERRLRESVERTLERSELTLDDVPTAKMDAWPRFEARLEALEMKDGYAGIFGGPSSYIHGTWHELLFYNLRSVPGGFELDSSWAMVRPQPVLALAVATAMAAVDYIDYLLREYAEVARLKDRLVRSITSARRVDELHEAFLTR